tara:strand:+ start:1199 stop:1822 length:624 start_codon:yes stop_codon:yes gene_type:complete
MALYEDATAIQLSRALRVIQEARIICKQQGSTTIDDTAFQICGGIKKAGKKYSFQRQLVLAERGLRAMIKEETPFTAIPKPSKTTADNMNKWKQAAKNTKKLSKIFSAAKDMLENDVGDYKWDYSSDEDVNQYDSEPSDDDDEEEEEDESDNEEEENDDEESDAESTSNDKKKKDDDEDFAESSEEEKEGEESEAEDEESESDSDEH